MKFTGRPSRALPLGAGLLATLLMGAACSGGSTADDGGSDTQTPVRGGTLVHRIAADPACVDPQQARLRAALGVLRQTVDSLTFQGEDGAVRPWLAQSWEVAPDATAYTFHLRDGVTFSDGSPLDAQTVADNLVALHDMGATASVAAPYLSAFASATAPDPSTVQITFSSPQAQFLQATSTPSLGIVSEATLGTDLAVRCQQGVIGTGPFTLDEYRPNDGITLSRRTGYAWAPEGFQNQGEAYLDGVDVQFVPDTSVGAGMLLSAQVDSSTDVSLEDAERLGASGVDVRTRPMPGFTTGFFLNVGRGPLADEAVRFALLRGLDRDTLVAAGGGAGVEVAAKDVVSSTTPGFTDHSDLMAYDPDAASAALDDAGWVRGADGIRSKDGQRLTLQINYMAPSSNPYIPLLELAQQGYGDLGIDIQINPITAAQDNELRISGDYDIRFNGLSRADADVISGVFRGMDPTLDTLLATQAGEADADARGATVAEATQLVLQNAYYVPINDAVQGQAFTAAVHGFEFDATNTPSMGGVWLTR